MTTASDGAPGRSPIPGPKVMLLGPSGTGKTHSLRTLIDCGITPFVLFTEQGMDICGDLPPDKFHWHYIRPTGTPWSTLTATAKMINQLSFSARRPSAARGRPERTHRPTMMGPRSEPSSREAAERTSWLALPHRP